MPPTRKGFSKAGYRRRCARQCPCMCCSIQSTDESQSPFSG